MKRRLMTKGGSFPEETPPKTEKSASFSEKDEEEKEIILSTAKYNGVGVEIGECVKSGEFARFWGKQCLLELRFHSTLGLQVYEK